ncbi:MAG: HD domain-containing protein [Lachnospiraceae bacterium]|nr:HD domain-containing protein [Lachnospiraceae bacterium]
MFTREFEQEFINAYENNAAQLKDWNEKLLGDMPQGEWIKMLKDRSLALREIYAENEKVLESVRANIREGITYDEAVVLYDLLVHIYGSGYDDLTSVILLSKLVLPFFEDKNDYAKMARLNYIKGDELAILYRLIGEIVDVQEMLDSYKKVMSLRDKIDDIDDVDAIRAIFLSHINYIMFVFFYNRADLRTTLELIEDTKRFFSKDKVKKACKDFEGLEKGVDGVLMYVYDALLLSLGEKELDGLRKDKDVREFYEKYLLPNKAALSESAIRATQIICENKDVHIWAREYKEEVLDMIEHLDLNCEDRHLVAARFMAVSDNLLFLLNQLNNGDYTKEEKKECTDEIFKKLHVFVSKLPYSWMTFKVNSALAEWLEQIIKIVDEEDTQKLLVKELLLLRQPVTYIHTLMVSEISEYILRSVLDEKPELLVGLFGYDSIEKVLRHQDEIVDFIKNASIVHDIGKCYITDIINRQDRALIEEEIQLIRFHPELGYKIIKSASGLSKYGDIVIGHHKFYNGCGGYPDNFDNTASPIRVLIDIITIADSIDAATDILGRNYAEGKDFKVLMAELKAQAGTRYSDVIVNLIDNDSSLKTELSYITAEGRYDVYRQAYKNIRGNRNE